MPAFLIADDQKEILEILEFVLESHFDCKIFQAQSGNQAIQLLKDNPIDVVICDEKMEDGSGGDVFRFITKNKPEIPFILCSNYSPEKREPFNSGKIAGFAEKPFFQESLIKSVKSILSTSAPASVKDKSPAVEAEKNLVRIKIGLLMLMNTLPTDVHIKLSEEKYVNLFREGEIFDQNDLKKYQAKNVNYLYVPLSKAAELFQKAMMELLNAQSIRKKNGEPQRGDEWTVLGDALDSIQDLLPQLGMTPELEKMTKMTVDATLNLMTEDISLDALFRNYVGKGKSYCSSHSVALSFTSAWLAHKMNWHSETTLYKLTLASLLHDITLTDPELAKIQSENEFDQDKNIGFTPKQIDQWKDHPILASRIAQGFKEVPPDVDVIISQHHERPDGSGMPAGLNHNRIAPISALFIVAHDLIRFCEENPKSEMRDYLKASEEKFSQGYFKKILKSIS